MDLIARLPTVPSGSIPFSLGDTVRSVKHYRRKQRQEAGAAGTGYLKITKSQEIASRSRNRETAVEEGRFVAALLPLLLFGLFPGSVSALLYIVRIVESYSARVRDCAW